jgi:hypothetical protein
MSREELEEEKESWAQRALTTTRTPVEAERDLCLPVLKSSAKPQEELGMADRLEQRGALLQLLRLEVQAETLCFLEETQRPCLVLL